MANATVRVGYLVIPSLTKSVRLATERGEGRFSGKCLFNYETVNKSSYQEDQPQF